jgi:hypothetical protein
LLEQKRAFGTLGNRKDHRVKLAITVLLRGKNIFDEPFEEKTVTENVSSGGICVQSRQFLGIGSSVQVEAYGRFKAEAKVVVRWSRDSGGGLFLIGLQFLQTEGEWLVKQPGEH